jgi:hypothetical protein
MKNRVRWLSVDFLIGSLIIISNLFAWINVGLFAPEPYRVAPIRDPEIVALLEYIRSGEHAGEKWQVTLTELEAEQTITWYLERYPQIPFEHPRVQITSDFVAGEGDATIAGIRIHVRGKARVTLQEGLPRVEILDLSLPLPATLRHALEQEMQRQLKRADQLPVRFTQAAWKDGEVVVTGVIR